MNKDINLIRFDEFQCIKNSLVISMFFFVICTFRFEDDFGKAAVCGDNFGEGEGWRQVERVANVYLYVEVEL